MPTLCLSRDFRTRCSICPGLCPVYGLWDRGRENITYVIRAKTLFWTFLEQSVASFPVFKSYVGQLVSWNSAELWLLLGRGAGGWVGGLVPGGGRDQPKSELISPQGPYGHQILPKNHGNLIQVLGETHQNLENYSIQFSPSSALNNGKNRQMKICDFISNLILKV